MASRGLRGAGSGEAAREHLAAGQPIYIANDQTPANHVIRRYPDGRQELLDCSNLDELRVVAELEPVQPIAPGQSPSAPALIGE
ncbi:hypothetical protein [Azospirillum formosense]|nr:hypothetical protein [Azospirillum formosense]MBY3754602.1 hypothetical protein [Azospirillum formosense]